MSFRAKRIMTAVTPVSLARTTRSYTWQTLRHSILVVILGVCSGIFAAHAQSTWLVTTGTNDFTPPGQRCAWEYRGHRSKRSHAGGPGTIGGSVTVLNGGPLHRVPSRRPLSVGSLLLNSGSILDYQLSTPGVVGWGVNTLVNVGGDLTLAGVLNVTNGGNFGSGSYRLLNYGGTLTNLTLDLGTLPGGFSAAKTTVTTAVAGQVNLVVNAKGASCNSGTGRTRSMTVRCMAAPGPGTPTFNG